MKDHTLCDTFSFSLKVTVFVKNYAPSKRDLCKGFYNQFHNILRLFDVLPNFPVTTSEKMADYCS